MSVVVGQIYRTPEGKEWVLADRSAGGHSHVFLSLQEWNRQAKLVAKNRQVRVGSYHAKKGEYEYANDSVIESRGWQVVGKVDRPELTEFAIRRSLLGEGRGDG